MADGGISANSNSVIVAAIGAFGLVIAAFLPGYMALKKSREEERSERERDAIRDHERRRNPQRGSHIPVHKTGGHNDQRKPGD